jgi:hypothetical protein
MICNSDNRQECAADQRASPTLSIMHVIWGYVALKRNFVTGSHCTHLATKINGENGSRDPQILKLWVLDGSDRLASSSG